MQNFHFPPALESSAVLQPGLSNQERMQPFDCRVREAEGILGGEVGEGDLAVPGGDGGRGEVGGLAVSLGGEARGDSLEPEARGVSLEEADVDGLGGEGLMECHRDAVEGLRADVEEAGLVVGLDALAEVDGRDRWLGSSRYSPPRGARPRRRGADVVSPAGCR